MNFNSAHLAVLRNLLGLSLSTAADEMKLWFGHAVRLEVADIASVRAQATLTPPPLSLHPESMRPSGPAACPVACTIMLPFEGALEGDAVVSFRDGIIVDQLITALTGCRPSQVNGLHCAVVTEVAGIMLNAVMTSLTGLLATTLSYQIPTYSEQSTDCTVTSLHPPAKPDILLVTIRFGTDGSALPGVFNLALTFRSIIPIVAALDDMYATRAVG